MAFSLTNGIIRRANEWLALLAGRLRGRVIGGKMEILQKGLC